ncbi:DUF6932 family protein [Methanocalculus chunghsingensis]|uniref:DUF6932 family protein n=1 Tax=Methanocalculus chunghsingensis TaxID=156457 RepID=UPI001B8CE1F9|nr:hypothetical protein [Methanocalculus chunghsingensis]
MRVERDAIPQWNSDGVIPPVNVHDPISHDRSPYSVSFTDIILRFGITPRRQAILKGLLEFRSALYTVGLIRGFQWIDGSFLEDIERREERDPEDIDLVTFFHLPDGVTEEEIIRSAPGLFNHESLKSNYHVDAYFVRLNAGAPEILVDSAAYWYSLWSHRRDGQWKGFLQIDLSNNDDTVAQRNLDELMGGGDSV